VGIFLAYVSRKGHALVDLRLYLPKEWAQGRPRRKAAGVPKAIRSRTRQQLAPEMLDGRGKDLPHAWVAGDDEMGRPAGFRRDLQGRGERYLLGVPSSTLIRDLEVPPPAYAGRGRRPKTPFARPDRWRSGVSEEGWVAIEVRDGERGPPVIEAIKRRVQARTATGGTGPEELLSVTRERQSDKTYKLDYYLSNAARETSLEELARVAKAAHRIEACLERAKGEAGLADYQVRNWIAWHHHQTLSLLAAWFLSRETQRGKKPDPRVDNTATAAVDRRADRGPPRREQPVPAVPPQYPLAAAQRASQALPSSLT
jgi:SRSO17 transposase